jgi:hypothetical protein
MKLCSLGYSTDIVLNIQVSVKNQTVKELLQPAKQPLFYALSIVLICRCQHTAYPLPCANVNDSGVSKIAVKDKKSGP